MDYSICDFTADDAARVDELALQAFRQYHHDYSDWAAFRARISHMSGLAEAGELIVARVAGRVAGAVAYFGPGTPKSAFFPREWPILRMLVVDPGYRGIGLGHALTHACIERARRDQAKLIALHTSPIMKVALAMYTRMGFQFVQAAPEIFGVPYGIYVLPLNTPESAA